MPSCDLANPYMDNQIRDILTATRRDYLQDTMIVSLQVSHADVRMPFRWQLQPLVG